jgi:hypothetical protein
VPGFGGGSLGVPVVCTPPSGSTFPIGTTTVNCTANHILPPPLGGTATGSFTVTVIAGTPSIQVSMLGRGRDVGTGFWVDLQLTNVGTGNALGVNLASLTLRTLLGTGSVTYDAVRSGPLPLQVGGINVGATRIVRVYLNVPLTVQRFTITEAGTLQDVLGNIGNFSAAQAVFP